MIEYADLVERMKEFDWKVTFYDPLHDSIEAESEEDRQVFARLESLISDLQIAANTGPESRVVIAHLVNQFWKGTSMEDQIENLFPTNKVEGMMQNHVISDEVFKEALRELSENRNWIAYNTASYFLGKGDMYFFKTADEAHEFAYNNISEYDNYRVMHAYSPDELLKQFPYGEKLKKQLTDPDANGLYNKDGNAFTDALIEHMERQQTLKNKNLSIMNDKNFEYLKDNIKYMGFGEKQHDALEQHLKEGKESFQLKFTAEVNKKPFEAVLNFRKSDNSDMYFFNSYQASLERNNGEKLDQTFYLTKGKGVTAKEAYNLLEGRPVFKELSNKAGEPYKAWIQLDFENKDKHNNHEVKQYHENYGYDLKAALSKYPIVELNGADKEKSLLQSLQKGNIQSVTVEKDGNVQKVFVEANPQYKTVTMYDAHLKRMQKEDLAQLQSQSVSNGKEAKNEKKEEIKQDSKKNAKQKVEDGIEGSKKKNSRKRGMSV